MTIVFFARYFYPHIGGVEKHVFEVATRLVKKGHKVIVIAEAHDTSLRLRETYQGMTIYRIGINGSEKEKKYQIWQWLFRHRKLLTKADIIHCHDVFYWYLPFRLILPRKRIFTTFHGYEGDTLPTKRAKIMHKLAEKLSRGNICVGDYVVKWYKTKPDFVTYGGVSVERDLLFDKKKDTKNLSAVFIGRLEPEASILGFLKMLTLLAKRGLSLTLVVVGDGTLRKKAEAYVKTHGLSVQFVGSQKNVSSFLSQADIVCTSRYLSTLEAFGQKKYVFCLYNNAIHRDCFALSPFGQWMSLAGEPHVLADAVIGYRDKTSLRIHSIDHAYDWAKKQTWGKLTKQYETLWSKK